MSAKTPLLAALEIEDVKFNWQKVSPATREGLLVFGALLLMTLLLLIWAAYFRKLGRRRRSSHRRPSGSRDAANKSVARTNAGVGSEGDASAALLPAPGKQRRRRRELPTNPTLAQTGGLPPIRTDDPSQTSP